MEAGSSELDELPSLLGLGDVILRDRERPQPHAGRLDLLFQHAEEDQRYEVEVQLGATDESHIIRTIEYWDLERKRYPRHDHTAAIVAEQITRRFLNVISLFNGQIPLIAIQMQAIQVGEQVSLVFTKVLDQLELGAEDEEDVSTEVADRAYWEKRSSKAMLELADSLFSLVREIDETLSPTYKTGYIGVSQNGAPNDFVVLKPKRDCLWIEPRIPRDADLESKLEGAGAVIGEYRDRWGRYRIRLDRSFSLPKSREVIREIIKRAYDQHFE